MSRAVFCLVVSLGASATFADAVEFNRDVRPILSDNCYACHGPDAETREANLRLDTAEGIVADLGGYQAVVPGDADGSELIKRVTHADVTERMPPEETNKELTGAQIATLRAWIDEGAVWQDHWSFEPIVRNAPPALDDSAWVRNPIDAFVLEGMREQGLQPSGEAASRSLARRLALDLTGLPPAREWVEDFERDPSDSGYEKLVERLLGTTGYGEHRAHYWLDAARYADTHGFHFDNFRSIWPYRDWVVAAFNDNMPFDQFTVEQLAGDMLPDASTSQRVATGFIRSNPTTNEGGAINDEYLAIYASDRAQTTATVWMGMTVGCAACHDHKFDPIAQREFYELTAFFRNTTQPAMDGNRHDSPPYLIVPAPGDEERKQEIESRIADLQKELDVLDVAAEFAQWRASGQRIADGVPVAPEVLELSARLDDGSATISGQSVAGPWQAQIGEEHEWRNGALGVTNDTAVDLPDVAGFNVFDRFSVSFWIKPPEEHIAVNPLLGRFDPNDSDRGWKINITENGNLVVPLRADGVVNSLAFTTEGIAKNEWSHVVVNHYGTNLSDGLEILINGEPVKIVSRTAVLDVSNFVGAAPVDRGLVIGGTDAAQIAAEKAAAEKAAEEAADAPQEEQAEAQAGDQAVTEVSVEAAEPAEPRYVALRDVRIFNDALSEDEVRRLGDAFVLRGAPAGSGAAQEAYFKTQLASRGAMLTRELRELRRELAEIAGRSVATLIVEEKQDSQPAAHVLVRGQYDNPGDAVVSGVPAVLPKLEADEVANRLDLARWLVRPDHPLTARVTVNRFWRELFGTGLVATTDDFGSQGEAPSHPELLDWLASEFIESGWDVKRLFRLMVMSSTYRQSSKVTPELLAADPENRLLARGARFRLDAEVIRDQALEVSGLLIDSVGGPPVRPYQPKGVWSAVGFVGSNTDEFHQGLGDQLYRRSLYTLHKRTAAPPSMAVFDAASRESCATQREVTNTPMQALLLLNDPQFVEAARHLAQRVLQVETADRFAHLLEHVLVREPDEQMVGVLEQTHAEVAARYRDNPQAARELLGVGDSEWSQNVDPAELAAWTILASQVMNLDEFVTKP